MINSAFLHIGGEKTGTTTLQHFLSQNAALLKQAGVYYPCSADNICFDGHAHFPVAACLIDGEVEFVSVKRQRTLPSVLNELTRMCMANDGALILSCEHFSSRLDSPQQLLRLRDALPTDEIKIVFYAREPSKLALAAWSTSILCGARHNFTADAITPQDRYFNHLQTLDLWAEVFGKDNLIVREYDRAQLVDGDIRWDFCRQLGLEQKAPLLEDDKNNSLDLQRLEILRQINVMLPQFKESPHDWRRAQRIRHSIINDIPKGVPLDLLLREHDANEIKARFSDVTEMLNQRYFGGRLSRKWFPDLSADQPAPASSEACQDERLVPILLNTIVRIAERTHEYEISRPEKVSRWFKFDRRVKDALKVIEQKLRALSGRIVLR